MKAVGTRFGHQVIDRAGAIAVLCRHVQLQLLKFLNRVLDRRIDVTAAQTFVRDSVD